MKRFGVLFLALFVGFVFSEENNYSARAIVFDTATDENENRRRPLSGLFAGSCRNQKSQIEANDCAMSKCLKTGPGSNGTQSCIISMEGKKDVYKENIAAYFYEKRLKEIKERNENIERERIAKIERKKRLEKQELDRKLELIKQENQYVAQKKQSCVKYGFKKDADIAECVRKSIADDKANEIALKKIKEENQTKLKEEQKLAQQQLLLQQQQQALIYQQQQKQQQENQARSNCYMSGKSLQGGIAGTLEIIGNCNNNPYGNSNANQICNFKHWNGLIIQGDCSQSSIILGNEVYQKIQ